MTLIPRVWVLLQHPFWSFVQLLEDDDDENTTTDLVSGAVGEGLGSKKNGASARLLRNWDPTDISNGKVKGN